MQKSDPDARNASVPSVRVAEQARRVGKTIAVSKRNKNAYSILGSPGRGSCRAVAHLDASVLLTENGFQNVTGVGGWPRGEIFPANEQGTPVENRDGPAAVTGRIPAKPI